MKPPWALPVLGSDLFWLHQGTKVPVGSSVSRLATPVSHELECHRHWGQRSREAEQRSHFLGSRTRYCGETSFRDRQGVALGPGKAAGGFSRPAVQGAEESRGGRQRSRLGAEERQSGRGGQRPQKQGWGPQSRLRLGLPGRGALEVTCLLQASLSVSVT